MLSVLGGCFCYVASHYIMGTVPLYNICARNKRRLQGYRALFPDIRALWYHVLLLGCQILFRVVDSCLCGVSHYRAIFAEI